MTKQDPEGDDWFFHPAGDDGRRRMRLSGMLTGFVICTGAFTGTASVGLGFRRALILGVLIALVVVVYGATRGFQDDWWDDDTDE